MTQFQKTCERQDWTLIRNCAMRPRNFALQIAGVGLLNALIGAVFWTLGYPGVMVACGLQVLFLTGACLIYASHAVDGERVHFDSEMLRVETVDGFKRRVHSFYPAWVCLERGRGSALAIRTGAMRIPIGRHVSESQRFKFANEFSATLALARTGQLERAVPALRQPPTAS